MHEHRMPQESLLGSLNPHLWRLEVPGGLTITHKFSIEFISNESSSTEDSAAVNYWNEHRK